MSSTGYSTALWPDARLRSIVALSGALAIVAGLLIITALPLAPAGRAVAGVGWLAFGGWQLARLVLAWQRCKQFRIASDGAVTIDRGDGLRDVGRLGPGSLVLARLAWLRLEGADGRRWAEPLAGHTRESASWRRLHVIWRHLGSAE